MKNNFYIGIVCHKKKLIKSEYNEKLVLYSNDNFNYIDLINGVVYTIDNSNKDYVIEHTLIPTDISEHRIDYIYLLSKYNSNKYVKRKK